MTSLCPKPIIFVSEILGPSITWKDDEEGGGWVIPLLLATMSSNINDPYPFTLSKLGFMQCNIRGGMVA